MDVVTIGETMTVFTPNEEGPLRHARSLGMKVRLLYFLLFNLFVVHQGCDIAGGQ